MLFARSFVRFVLAAAAWRSSAILTLAECLSGRLAWGRDRLPVATSYRSAQQGPNWWPAGFGTTSAVGAQNDPRYAVFPRRLVIQDGGRIEIYDTGNHRIFGVAQAQSADQTLTFTSQDGLVRVKDLPKVRDEG
jgi:hypothetical protein